MAEFASKTKKSIEEMTKQFAPFWEELLSSETNAYFISKLAYTPKGTKEPSMRLYGSELGKNDIFLEFHNWDSEYFHPGQRVLYKLKYDPDWRSKIGTIYQETDTKNSFIVKLSDLEKVSNHPATAASSATAFYPVPTPTSFASLDEEEPVSEMEDSHQTAMTIRDWYSIINNVPVSNKKWLNKLIKENNK